MKEIAVLVLCGVLVVQAMCQFWACETICNVRDESKILRESLIKTRERVDKLESECRLLEMNQRWILDRFQGNA
jgi:hypothetical protein